MKNNFQLSTSNSQLPKGWEVKELGDVCERIFAGGDKPQKVSKYKTDDLLIPIFANGEKDKGLYGYTDIAKVEKQSITISGRGTIGYSEIRKKPFVPIVRLITLIPNSQIIDIKFLHYGIKNIDFTNSGSSIPQLTVPMAKGYSIPIPPIPEQQRIVEILDKAFVAIDKAKQNAEQNLRNAKEVFESYLQGVFENKGDDWEEKTLKEISEDFGRGKSKHRPRNDKKLYGGDYPFIQTGDIRNCEHYITDYSQTYNNTGLAQSKLWPTGTICITIAANIAETGILSFDACFPDSVIGIVVNTKITNVDFVEYLLQSFKVNLQSLGKGSAQDNINMGTFENKLFPFPLIKEQKQIVQELNNLYIETKKLELIYQEKLENLAELKKSILQRAFTGELV